MMAWLIPFKSKAVNEIIKQLELIKKNETEESGQKQKELTLQNETSEQIMIWIWDSIIPKHKFWNENAV